MQHRLQHYQQQRHLLKFPFSLALIMLLAALLTISFHTHAYTEEIERNLNTAMEQAMKVAKQGPDKIGLGMQAMLDLPEHMIFIPVPQAANLMEAYGNSKDPDLLGVVLPIDEESNWIATIEFQKEGYIKEDDAKKWDTNELLQSLKDGTEAANKDRAKRGFPELVVLGWAEVPKYDANKHRLVWSALANEKNAKDEDPSVNYNTYALGREGYISLDLITSAQELPANRQAALTLLNNIHYQTGKRYEDFDPTTDKIAAYGLAALVAGVAAKKIGLIALIIAFALKFIKLIIAAVVVVFAVLVKFFKGKEAKAPATHSVNGASNADATKSPPE